MMPCRSRAEQRRRRPLAGHVAEGEAEHVAGQVHDVVEVAADRAAGNRSGPPLSKNAAVARLAAAAPAGSPRRCGCPVRAWPSPCARSIQPRVLDGRATLRRRAFRARLASTPRAVRRALAAVEVEHADAARCDRPDCGGVVDVADDDPAARHRTWRMPSATRAACGRRPARRRAGRRSTRTLPVANTSSGILRLVWKVLPSSMPLGRAPRPSLELERAVGRRRA